MSRCSRSSMAGRRLISIDDLSDGAIDRILLRAAEFSAGAQSGVQPIAASLFIQPSLRTRVGFGIACARLGGQMVDAVAPKFAPGMSTPERLLDALRTLTGMANIVIARAPDRFADLPPELLGTTPFVNGGDAAEHPTQALIDLAAMERESGPVQSLRVGICGDLTSRCATSLLRLLRRRRPMSLVLYSPPSRRPADDVIVSTSSFSHVRDGFTPDDVDVLVMVGLAEGHDSSRIDETTRLRYSLRRAALRVLPDRAIVLSPMPVIDELGDDARRDPRLRMFEQADYGVFVRMAVIEEMLEGEEIQDEFR